MKALKVLLISVGALLAALIVIPLTILSASSVSFSHTKSPARMVLSLIHI